MNRYRTTPGLGPSASKATSTTTCQKCLQKGHYSYECKASVQSRPYTSRPSRSQQLQNPRLKPTLTEQKMEATQEILASAKSRQSRVSEDSAVPFVAGEEAEADTIDRKRRRSASTSSSASVTTISTNKSDSKPELEVSRSLAKRGDGIRSRSSSASRAGAEPRISRSKHRRHEDDGQPRVRQRLHAQARSDSGRAARDSDGSSSSSLNRRGNRTYRERVRTPAHGRKASHGDKRRRSRSPEILPDTRRQRQDPRDTRRRSLSPYSRRLALTQAMNADN